MPGRPAPGVKDAKPLGVRIGPRARLSSHAEKNDEGTTQSRLPIVSSHPTLLWRPSYDAVPTETLPVLPMARHTLGDAQANSGVST